MGTPLAGGAITVRTGITASTNQAQGQGLLTTTISEIAIVANPDDAVTLISASRGLTSIVINNGDNSLQIFPFSGDNLGSGVDLSARLDPDNAIIYRAYNKADWVPIVTTQSFHGEMIDNNNDVEFVVTEEGEHHGYHTVGMAAGELGGGWNFDSGGAGTSFPIASIADGADSGVDIAVTTTGSHGLAVDDIISHTGVTSSVYSGYFKVKAVISDTVYEVAAVFTATDTGIMDQPATLTCPLNGAGPYRCTWSVDASPSTNNETFQFSFHLEEPHQIKSQGRTKFGVAGDVRAISTTCILDVAAGARLSFMVRNLDSTANITIRNLNVTVSKL